MDIKWISKNDDGNYYIGYQVEVSRGIRGKTKGKVDEVIIVGLHKSKLKSFCEAHSLDYNMIKKEIG